MRSPRLASALLVMTSHCLSFRHCERPSRILLAFLSAVFLSFSCLAEPIYLTKPDAPEIKVEVELATTPEAREQGLMFRERLDPDKGMLFVYEAPTTVAMWMKNTKIPLDMLFLDKDSRVIHIHKNAKPFSLNLIGPVEDVKYVLEVPAGFADFNKMDNGYRMNIATKTN